MQVKCEIKNPHQINDKGLSGNLENFMLSFYTLLPPLKNPPQFLC